MIRLKIDVTKIDKTKLFKGAKGTYLDVTLIERHGDKYGNDYMAVQDVGAEARKRGEKGAILGNGKLVAREAIPTKEAPPASATQENLDEDVPF